MLKEIIKRELTRTIWPTEKFKYNIGGGSYLYSFKSTWFTSSNISIDKFFGVTRKGYAEQLSRNPYNKYNIYFSIEDIIKYIFNYNFKTLYFINKKDPYYIYAVNKNHILKLLSEASEKLMGKYQLDDSTIQKLIKEDADYPLFYITDGVLIRYWYSRVVSYEGDGFRLGDNIREYKSEDIGSSIIWFNNEIKNEVLQYVANNIKLQRTKKLKVVGVTKKVVEPNLSNAEIEALYDRYKKEYERSFKTNFVKALKSLFGKTLTRDFRAWDIADEFVAPEMIAKEPDSLKRVIFRYLFDSEKYLKDWAEEYFENNAIKIDLLKTRWEDLFAILPKGEHTPVIFVDKEYAGRVIGKGGANIKKVCSQYGFKFIKIQTK